jgi:hypothetical protein
VKKCSIAINKDCIHTHSLGFNGGGGVPKNNLASSITIIDFLLSEIASSSETIGHSIQPSGEGSGSE